MTKEERSKKISELYHFCNMQDSCDPCELEDLSFDCEFNGMDDKKINRFYDIMVGYKTRVAEDDAKQKSKTITEKLTGIAKEDQERPRTVTNILEEVRTEMCDGYCIYPMITPGDYERYKRICNEECPLNKL